MRIIAVDCEPGLEDLCSQLLQEVVRHEQNRFLWIILGIIISLSAMAIVLIITALNKRKTK